MTKEMEHWRDVQQSEYLASWDFQKDKETLTISEVKNEYAKLQKKEIKVIAHFKETQLSCGTKVKPMILNNTNLKFLQDKTQLRHQKLWTNIQVEISIKENNSKIGGKKKLVITDAKVLNPFNISEILSITDFETAKEKATLYYSNMNAEEIQQVKAHLEKIKPQK